MLQCKFEIINYIYEIQQEYKYKSCLEIGCGDGSKSNIISCMFEKYTAIDNKECMVNKLPHIDFIETTIEDLKTSDEFDCIIMIDTFHLINDLEYTYHLLKYKGTIIIIEPVITQKHWIDLSLNEAYENTIWHDYLIMNEFSHIKISDMDFYKFTNI
jgi:2-polyprenyl-3-methyl-5-hydroxy-6-metoxy-1,4-benzoquinol methylase